MAAINLDLIPAAVVTWHDGAGRERRTRLGDPVRANPYQYECHIRFELQDDDGEVVAAGRMIGDVVCGSNLSDDVCGMLADWGRRNFGATVLRYLEPGPEGQWQTY